MEALDGKDLTMGRMPSAELSEDDINGSVQGRIAFHSQWWFNNLELSSLVLDVLESGYKIPFKSTPLPSVIKNNRSSLDNSKFVCKAINEVVLPKRSNMLLDGPGTHGAYRDRPSVFVGCPQFNMLALRVDFRH